MTKSVFVTLAGHTNAGKSSLLNAIIGEKIASVSPKPQTTRTRITGIKTVGETQMVFMDTPGLHKPTTKLSGHMLKAVKDAVADIDAVLFVQDCTKPLSEQEEELLRSLEKAKRPPFWCEQDRPLQRQVQADGHHCQAEWHTRFRRLFLSASQKPTASTCGTGSHGSGTAGSPLLPRRKIHRPAGTGAGSRDDSGKDPEPAAGRSAPRHCGFH
ncbi:MAG: GTPase [Ruminococcus callidus]